MAQPSVAREPSMEEILASIRRIIESNDPVTESVNTRTSHEVGIDFEDDDEGFVLSDEGGNPFLSQVPANDPGSPITPEASPLRPTHDAAQAPRVQAPEPEEKTLSLADVAARVRAAAGRVPEPMAQRSPAPALNAAAPVAAAHQRVVSADAHVPPRMQELAPVLRELEDMQADGSASDRHLDPAPDMAVAQRADAARVSAHPTETISVDASRPENLPSLRMSHTTDPKTLPEKIEEAASLISREAGEQVARSFKQLADIFNGIERQSMEDMAREMLKPMLREWLDDNLPTLVERMVREEIERVARGPRR